MYSPIKYIGNKYNYFRQINFNKGQEIGTNQHELCGIIRYYSNIFYGSCIKSYHELYYYSAYQDHSSDDIMC